MQSEASVSGQILILKPVDTDSDASACIEMGRQSCYKCLIGCLINKKRPDLVKGSSLCCVMSHLLY